MKRFTIAALIIVNAIGAKAQVVSNASFLKAQPKADVIIPFRYHDAGVKTPIEWGLDLAWADEANVRTGILYCGKELIDIMRLSFQPTASVASGSFSSDQLKALQNRTNIVKKWCKADVTYNLNCDHASLDDWYNEGAKTIEERAKNWAKLIDMTADYFKSKGIKNLVSISPLNEPDYDYHYLPTPSHRKADFKAICKLFKEDEAYKEKYADVRMCGGNTLNDDKAYEWWNYMKPYLDEGNTHQLAGNFDNYASFFEKVRNAGQHATADELHNVMEAMVGVEYGMQTGIWWGTAEYTRSQFMKATYQGNPGDRLAYAEHRTNWTAASVYRHTDGTLQGFGGSSERQAMHTTYNFTSLDHPVWYAGERGREYVMELTGPTTAGYQNGQTGAETLIDIQGGDDIMPHITAGAYKIMNANSGHVMGFSSKPTGWLAAVQKKSDNTSKTLQWIVTPNKKEGDYNYFTFQLNYTTGTPIQLDILNWNYEAGAEVGGYPNASPGTNEQWYLQYAGNGAFYIRSRFSAKCLEVKNGSAAAGAKLQLGDFKGEKYQQWRFIPTKATAELEAPATPSNLKAEANNASIRLTWEPVADKDLKSYTILRSEDGTTFYTIANELTTTDFTDNEANENTTYIYKVYAEDVCYNRSEASETVTATATGNKGEVMHLALAENLFDSTVNGNHAAACVDTTFTTYREKDCLSLNGSSDFIQLPYTIANHDEMSISLWVYYRGGNAWQRIFDFGNGESQYMFLTANYGSGLSFAIKNGGDEQLLRPKKSLNTTKWHNIVITLGSEGGKMYLDGEMICENKNLNIKPSDISPVYNYIGRSQFSSDPYFKGYISDFRIYNYVLSSDEVQDINAGTDNIASPSMVDNSSATATYDLSGRKITSPANNHIVIKRGKKVVK